MFDKNQQRYITRGVSARIPLTTQIVLWSLINGLGRKQELDYLQVFRLTSETHGGVILQAVAHEQERPPYRQKRLFCLPEAVTTKIFCIDDRTHSTMLLAEEY